MSNTREIVTIDSINVELLPEFQNWKEIQLKVVEENPFVEILDNKSFEEAKKARTALVTARTAIEKQDKLIASKLKEVRTKAANFSLELINITLPHEEKQQDEVKRYEQKKEAERKAKEEEEAKRVQKIKDTINSIVYGIKSKISSLQFSGLETFEKDLQDFYNTDCEPFEEFELEFASKIQDVKTFFNSKKEALEEAEKQRLEKERIEKENAELEEKKKAFELEQQKARQEAEQKAKEEAEKLEAQQKAIREQQEKANAKLEAQRLELEAEKAKIEAEQKAKEEAEQKAKEEAERLEREAKEKLEREAAEKAEKERIEALKPEKEKAIDFLNSLVFSKELTDPVKQIKSPEIMDELINFFDEVTRLQEQTITKINNL